MRSADIFGVAVSKKDVVYIFYTVPELLKRGGKMFGNDAVGGSAVYKKLAFAEHQSDAAKHVSSRIQVIYILIDLLEAFHFGQFLYVDRFCSVGGLIIISEI